MNVQTLNPAIAESDRAKRIETTRYAPGVDVLHSRRHIKPGETTALSKQRAVQRDRKAPISEARLAANRANAQKSTGPRTPEDKQVPA